MARLQKKTVFATEAQQVEQIQAVVRSGRYRSASEFLRDAVDEKLERLRRERLEKQVAHYCAEGYAEEDGDLVALQAFDSSDS